MRAIAFAVVSGGIAVGIGCAALAGLDGYASGDGGADGTIDGGGDASSPEAAPDAPRLDAPAEANPCAADDAGTEDAGCPPGHATCPGRIACEVLVDTDSFNCGWCGHRCEDTCRSGFCAPVVVATDPMQRQVSGVFAHAGDALYWRAGEDIVAGPIDGGTGASIATTVGMQGIEWALLNDDAIDFIALGETDEISIEAGAMRRTIAFKGEQSYSRLGADQSSVYAAYFGVPQTITAVDRTSGTTRDLYASDRAIASLARHGNYLYFVYGYVDQTPSIDFDGGPREIRRIAIGPDGGSPLLVRSARDAVIFTFDDPWIFWGDGDGNVFMAPIEDPQAPAQEITGGPNEIIDLWVDAQNVYFMDGTQDGHHGIYEASRCGGPPRAITPSTVGVSAATFDGTFFYYGDSNGRVLRVPR